MNTRPRPDHPQPLPAREHRMNVAQIATTRREFVRSTAAIAGLLAASPVLSAFSRPKADDTQPTPGKKNLRILILGGTGFLGPACVESAQARGHTLTLFNRGKTEARRKANNRPSQVPEGVEVLYGNRDPEKNSTEDANDHDAPKGLTSLQGKSWDAVIDTSGYWPRMVRASAGALANSAKLYVFVSTFSVYASNATPGDDESAALATMADPTGETFGDQFENYGPGKALCEKAAEEAMPERVCSVRPGFIVGPRDTSKRFAYWPMRCARGGKMAVPGTPQDPIMIVDVRDLADFIIKCVEDARTGAYNVSGPDKGHPMRTFVEQIAQGVGKATGDGAIAPTWIDPDFLEAQGMNPGTFPLWIPQGGDAGGFHQRSIARALGAGLTFRPLAETARATREWIQSLPENIQQGVVPPLHSQAEEDRLIAAWEARSK